MGALIVESDGEYLAIEDLAEYNLLPIGKTPREANVIICSNRLN